jgi:hypothetical protein
LATGEDLPQRQNAGKHQSARQLVMAIHQDLASLSAEALDEYFTLAEIGLKHVKTDGGCLGYPSMLLVFCAIDALSNHLGYPEHSFLALNDPIIGLNLTEPQRTRLKRWYRHLLAHNGMIAPGTVLTREESGRPIEFSASGEPTKIRVKVLFQIVKRAWDSFDRAKLRPRSVSLPTQQIDFSQASIAFPVASSGCNVQPKIVKM